jgi:putative effector of murein hydrolase
MAKGEGSNTHWTDALFKYTPDAKKLSASRGSSGGTGTSYSSDCTGQIRGLLPGQLFSLLLGPSCTALAFRIYAQQETVGKQLPAVLISSVVTAIASLFVSPAIGRIAGLPSQLNNILAHRSITSALAIPSATQSGASPELTVAAVLITGLYGASGGWLLDLFLPKPESGGTATTITVDATGAINQAMAANADMPVDQLNALRSMITSARGTVVGTTSHSIGTASLLSDDENKAAGIASVSMLIAGISHAIVASIPACTQWVQQIAGVEGA